MTSDVSINTALNQQANTSATRQQLAEDFNDFLILLTTQLQNQDPLDPMDTAEFTNQLVAFAGVEQQINANQKLDSLVSLQLANSFGSALGYVGMDISYLSSELNFDGSTPAKINYALEGEAVDAKLRILDENGSVVFETDAERNPGNSEFFWDGTLTGGGIAAPGTYSVQIDALDIEGQPVNATTVVTGNVRGIESQNGLIFLLVGDRAVALSNVLSASQPPAPAEEEPPAEEAA